MHVPSLVLIGLVVSEEKSFEKIVHDDDGRRPTDDDGRQVMAIAQKTYGQISLKM